LGGTTLILLSISRPQPCFLERIRVALSNSYFSLRAVRVATLRDS
jgi:hypothetical protein